MKSWRTTILGILAILGALSAAGKAYFDNDPATLVNIEATVGAIMAGIALILAKDHKPEDN